MVLEQVLRAVITGLAYAGVGVLLVAIVLLNLYAILHAWRNDRIGWVVVLTVLFLTGGGIATAVYLIVHHDEPLPASPRRRAPA